MNVHPFAQRILDFVFEAGRISLKYIDNSNASFKKDQSVLTIADQKISELLHERLRDLVQTGEHLIIDEEDPRVNELLDAALLDQAQYIWVCDPIDGTRSYANRMPQFGISLGLLKDRRPWMGAVYFPALGELFFADGTEAWFAGNAFSAIEKRQPVKPVHEPITGRSMLLYDNDFLKKHRPKNIQVLISGTSVVDLTWPAIGRGCGAVFGSSVWDFAGAWPVFEAAGLQLHQIKTGAALQQIDTRLFHKNWKLRDYYLLCRHDQFKTIRSTFS